MIVYVVTSRTHGAHMAHTWRTHGAHIAHTSRTHRAHITQTESSVSIQSHFFANRYSDQRYNCRRYRDCRTLLVFSFFEICAIFWMLAILVGVDARLSLLRSNLLIHILQGDLTSASIADITFSHSLLTASRSSRRIDLNSFKIHATAQTNIARALAGIIVNG